MALKYGPDYLIIVYIPNSIVKLVQVGSHGYDVPLPLGRAGLR